MPACSSSFLCNLRQKNQLPTTANTTKRVMTRIALSNISIYSDSMRVSTSLNYTLRSSLSSFNWIYLMAGFSIVVIFKVWAALIMSSFIFFYKSSFYFLFNYCSLLNLSKYSLLTACNLSISYYFFFAKAFSILFSLSSIVIYKLFSEIIRSIISTTFSSTNILGFCWFELAKTSLFACRVVRIWSAFGTFFAGAGIRYASGTY